MKALDFILRGFLFLVFFSTGLGHFLETDFYLAMMPPYIPFHLPIVLFTGFCECMMAIFIIIPETKKYAARVMILFLLAYLPAVLHMMTNMDLFPEVSRQLLMFSLPAHLLMIVMSWYLSGLHSPMYFLLKVVDPEELDPENQPPRDEDEDQVA
ncbi:MAG: hypothetical protein DRQ88_06690 [Epsilonproteobacteria bacterium]|nr:MAG: hypothetical protein DRQ89_02800 [Campylobacterota bacterium]RLA66401.1 MAG: hypothetical protein DRQ88_06690 [Campylobacterota bacterium]